MKVTYLSTWFPDRQQQYLPTTQQMLSTPLYEPWLNMRGNNSICSALSSCCLKDKQLPLCHTMNHKKRMMHTNTAHRFKPVRWKMQNETDVNGFLHDQTCCPTTFGLSDTVNSVQVIQKAGWRTVLATRAHNCVRPFYGALCLIAWHRKAFVISDE